jgi:hypothetical protein
MRDMNGMIKIAGSLSLAIGMSCMGHAAAAADRGAGVSRDNAPTAAMGSTAGSEQIQAKGLTMYLADPELGLAGRYSLDGQTVYFQARREFDPETGLSELRLHIVDIEARTVAATNRPPTGHEKSSLAIPLEDASALAGVLEGLSAQLETLNLHPVLSVEKAGLAGLAGQAAALLPVTYPVQLDSVQLKAGDASTDAVVDFYLRPMAPIKLKRGAGGMLIASLGDGLKFESAQFFRADEENEAGDLGRIDVYSRVFDSQGHHLGAEFGGDFVPDDWNDVLSASPERVRSHDEIAASMGAGAMALNALALGAKSSYGVAFSSELEQDSMHRLARSLSENLLPRRDESVSALDEVLTKSTGRYRTAIQVHKKWLVWPTEHSATRVYKHLFTTTTSSTYSVSGTINFCNHGACAGGTGMSQKCSYTGPRMGSYRVPEIRIVPTGQTGAGTRHTCSTNYGVAGILNHNCHDDSSVQVRAVRGLSYSHDGGRCRDYDFWATAPGC